MHRHSSHRATRYRAAHRSDPVTGAAAAVCFQAEPRSGCQEPFQNLWKERGLGRKHRNTAPTCLSLNAIDRNCTHSVTVKTSGVRCFCACLQTSTGTHRITFGKKYRILSGLCTLGLSGSKCARPAAGP